MGRLRAYGALALSAAALAALPGGSMAQPLTNLIANPRFDEGLLTPRAWHYNVPEGSQVTWQASPAGDAHAVLLEGVGRDWAGLTSAAIPVAPGDTLALAVWACVLPGPDASGGDYAYVRFFGERGFLGQEGPSFAGTGAEWRLLTGTVTAPADATRADLSVQIRSSAKVLVGAACIVRGDQPRATAELIGPPPTAVAWRPVDTAQNMPADADRNGLPDALEAFLGITPADGARSVRLTRGKTTSFQTPTGYREDNDLKVDAVIVAGNDETSIRSWAATGYEPHVMVGFRAGPDYVEQQGHVDEVQTASDGSLLDCGPGSYYMVPTENRRVIFRQYFADAVRRGAKAVCPEEPEFFSRAGYSDAFRREWQAFYGQPWQDPAGSVTDRYRAERLKAHLETELLRACYEGGTAADPNVQCFLLAHSPLNYTAWNIVFGHHDALSKLPIDAMVAQVWTGTARSPVPYEGRVAQRTFENAFLEYASSLGLVRGTGKELWFLMDPLEDNPDRTMEDYRDNYERSLVAALMFPEVDHFETMPWPTRIFGRVPDEFATVIGTAINALSDMQNQTATEWDAGPKGIGTFLADSAMWQRGAPSPSDMACFYGITLPLLMRGAPVEVPHLDRVADPGYLDRYHVLFVSYDILKPMRPEINEALARWAEDGGCLVVLGGDDAYNDVPEWWHGRGFASPQDDLLSRCGFDVSRRRVVGGPGPDAAWQTVAQTDYTGRNLENEGEVTIDLTPVLASGQALVRFEDTLPGDGWGPYITRLVAEGMRDGERVSIDVIPGSVEERALVVDDRASIVQPTGARFCDGEASVTYGFAFDAGSSATLRVTVGNQYRITAAAGKGQAGREFAAQGEAQPLGVARIAVPMGQSIVEYPGSGAAPVYANDEGVLLAERQLGKGRVLFCGLAPSYFAASTEAADQMRALARYACGEQQEEWREQRHIALRRGRYVMAKTFDEPLELEGRFIPLLQADLPVVDGWKLGQDQVALLYDAAPDLAGDPKLIYSSSCVEWRSDGAERFRAIVSGAEGTVGTCRLATGGRTVGALAAEDVKGKPVEVEQVADGDTLLLRYPNHPFGLALSVEWGR